MASSDEEEFLDELRGLQDQLDELRDVLGDGYVSLRPRGDERDALSDDELAGAAPPPRPAAAAAPPSTVQAASLTGPRHAAASPERGDSGESSEGESEDEESEEEDEEQQTARYVAAVLQPPQARRQPVRGHHVPASAPREQPQPGPGRARGRAAAQAAAAAGSKPGATSKPQPAKVAAKKRQPKRAAGASRDAEGQSQAPQQPERPHTKREAVQAALDANRTLQARLRRLLASTDRAINRNAAVMQQVRALRAKKSAPPAVATVAASGERAQLQAPIGSSWFWSGAAGGAGGAAAAPPPNPDAELLLPLYQHLPFSFRGSRWSEEEQQRLRGGVLQLVQEQQLQAVMDAMQRRLEEGGAVAAADYEAARARIASLALDDPAVDAAAAAFRDEDWATLVQRSRLHRTTTECRLQWSNSLAPSLSQLEWSAEEDAELRRLAEQRQGREWAAVSRELAAATGRPARPPLACLQRHQQLAAAAAREGAKFEAGEDMERLSRLVAKHGNAWKRIAEEFGGAFEAEALMHVWRRHAQRGPQARTGRWSADEDEALLKAMALHGTKWSLVARLVQGRTDVQCRERYCNVLSLAVDSYKPWSQEEDDELLRQAAAQRRPSGRVRWSAVAAALPGRTDKQCANRHRVVTSGESGSRAPKRKPKQAAGGEKPQTAPRAAKARKPKAPLPGWGERSWAARAGGGDEGGGDEGGEGDGARPRRARRKPVWLSESSGASEAEGAASGPRQEAGEARAPSEQPPQPQARHLPQPQAQLQPRPQAQQPPQPQAQKQPQPQAEQPPQPQVQKQPQPQAEQPPQPQAEQPPKSQAQKQPQPQAEQPRQPQAQKQPQPQAKQPPQPERMTAGAGPAAEQQALEETRQQQQQEAVVQQRQPTAQRKRPTASPGRVATKRQRLEQQAAAEETGRVAQAQPPLPRQGRQRRKAVPARAPSAEAAPAREPAAEAGSPEPVAPPALQRRRRVAPTAQQPDPQVTGDASPPAPAQPEPAHRPARQRRPTARAAAAAAGDT